MNVEQPSDLMTVKARQDGAALGKEIWTQLYAPAARGFMLAEALSEQKAMEHQVATKDEESIIGGTT